MIAIVGLGNPGRRYRGTRHNLGRDVVDRVAEKLGVELNEDGFARTARTQFGRAPVLLAIPETYMNVSGQAVSEIARRRRVKPENLLIIYDDLDLPVGRLRLRPANGAGGHNGIRSIIEHLGTKAFPRLRVGIGRPPAGVDAEEFVLQRFAPGERTVIDEAVERAAGAALAVVSDGLEAAMNRINVRETPARPAGSREAGPDPAGGVQRSPRSEDPRV
ncbi:MAG TPA: aminoacyl-tRNA hydrolase [bacterium]|nr:aminoacyl-tRNA hydrolase [bacterium]